MRAIERTGRFRRDYRREIRGRHGSALRADFIDLLTALARDQPLDERYRDHALTGSWKDHRDCHVKPDLVLIYRKPDDRTLQLVRIGSHAELGW